MNEVFNRIEKKYILNKEQFKRIKKILLEHMELDPYHNEEYTISSIYLDTDNFDLIRKSLDKPIYKEKVRLRSYGIPKLSDKVFLEIKKKYNGIGNKRRIKIELKNAYDFINGKKNINTQKAKELEYMINKNKLKPKIFIAYDRLAFEKNNFRITLDYNIRYRIEDINLEYGDSGKLLDKNIFILEAKAKKLISRLVYKTIKRRKTISKLIFKIWKYI